MTKDISPQETPKDVVSSEPIEGDDLSRLDEMFKKPRHRGYLDYECLLRSQGGERSSRIKEIVNDAIETRIYLDVLGIDLSKNPSRSDNDGSLNFDNILKWRLLSQGESGKGESKIFDLYMDTQGRLYDILLKRTEGRDISTEVASLKQTLDAVQSVTALLPKKQSDAWANAFSRLIDKVAPEVKSFLSGVGEFIQARGSQAQPPPPNTSPPPSESEIVERAGVHLQQLPRLSKAENGVTFAEPEQPVEETEEGLPREESEEENVSHEPVGGSTSEIEKRRGEKRE